MQTQVHSSSYQLLIPFGKYKGMSFGYLAENHPTYLDWLVGTLGIPEEFRVAAAQTLLGEPVKVTGAVVQKAIPKPPADKINIRIWQVNPTTSAVSFPFKEHTKDAFKSAVDGHRWNFKEARWEFPSVQLFYAIKFFKKLGTLTIDDASTKFFEAEKKRRAKLDLIRKSETSHVNVPLKEPLRPYQNVAVEFMEQIGYRGIVADDPGVGKTATAIGIAVYSNSKTLFICQKSTKHLVWERNIKRFTGKTACVWEGSGPTGNVNAQFHVINYDIVAKNIDALRDLKFDLLVPDEATYLKNHNSIRAKSIFGKWNDRKDFPGLKTKYLVALTGTPILNRPIEAYTLLSNIDKKRFSNPNHFINRYGVRNNEARNLDELHERCQDVVIRRRKADVLKDLPPKQRNELYAEMSPNERKQYNKMIDEVLGSWKSSGVPSAADMPKVRNFLFELKLPRIIEFIDEMLEAGRPVLTFSIQVAHAERIAKHYGDRARLLHGQITGKRRQTAIDDLAAGNATVGAFTINAGGMGIDSLQATMSDVLFTDFWWVPAIHEQAEDRLHRSGQEREVTAWYMVVENTMDEIMRDILAEKQKIIDAVVDGKLINRARSQSIFKEVVMRMAAQRKAGLKFDKMKEEELSD